ncbi:dihydroorotase [Aliidiomarina sanyensis]|uniref:Dihydroorotase n=1 Tax=Aliidiomarina sanyensis TaxID=1249555 RepID=A0A432WIC3_9GAMM|nr:dihydroorotase [Aliidiomarina sanyensis]RUO33429.1 dihydroorotase [Aliidiomarina sanyensis]
MQSKPSLADLPEQITITRPDDWHVHLRDEEVLGMTVPATARVFHRTVVMPNLVPPVTDAALAGAYRQRIMAELPEGMRFDPKMALYLTQSTTETDVKEAAADPTIIGYKLYPAGATTNSASGVTDIDAMGPVFEAMELNGVPLLVHGEVTTSDIDIFDREKAFIDRYLEPITRKFPGLKVVFEHITTADAVDFVLGAHANVGATITPQHLLMNRNDLLVGGVHVHNYCLPVLKRRTHQEALQRAAISGNPKFFLGTDSAPHVQAKKETACGCAGCFSAFSAIELYAEAFAHLGALDKLEGFASFFGADFYNLPRNTETLVLEKKSWHAPERIEHKGGVWVPYWAGRSLMYQVKK